MIMKYFRKYQIGALLLWQLISVYLMATGVWPGSVAWANLLLVLAYILLAPAFSGLLLVVASIPFYIVLPQHYSDTLSMWRPVVGVLFLKTLFGAWQAWSGSSPREGRLGGVVDTNDVRTNVTSTSPNPSSWRRGINAARGMFFEFSNLFLGYEKLAIGLFVIALLSLALARYPVRGVSQLLFLLNTFLLYPVVVWTVKNRTQLVRLLTYGALSSGIVIALGYIQFIATLFSTTYYFWQYWAIRVASLYYGVSLARVLQYSNSWVAVQGEAKTLRMFSVMTSSHAFAMVCVLFLAFALPLLFVRVTKAAGVIASERSFVRWVWVVVVFACLALIISGTRGVWAGMIPALLFVGFLYYWTRFKHYVVPVFAAMLLVVILFEASPLLDRGFTWVRNSGGESTLDRVASIIDLEETSNAGRLEMWNAASKYAVKHPLGVGYGNFVVTLSPDQNVSFEEAASKENNLYNLPQRYITAHSLYLQLLVELSLLGLILFGLFWLVFFHRAWRYVASERVTAESVFITTLFLVFIWFLAYGVFDVTWLNDKILLYTFVLIGAARVVFTGSQDASRD